MNNQWDELLEFESKDLIQNFFKQKHNFDVNDWKVQEVASNVIQGREYFRSAKKASMTVKPLLLYYGIVSLSRALVLILRPKLRETSLKGSHGIEVRNWSEVLTVRKFEDIELVIGEGSFSELISATENKSYIRVNTSGVNWQVKHEIPTKGVNIKLKEVFQFLPDLKDEYQTWMGENLPFAKGSISNFIRKENEKYVVSMTPDSTAIDKIFPTHLCEEREIIKDSSSITVKFKDNWFPTVTQKWEGPFDIGDPCFVPILNPDVKLNLLSSMFAISYTFGMMARYFPTTWISLSRVQKGDRIFPIINKSLKLIEKRYPQTILDFLRAPYNFEATDKKENETETEGGPSPALTAESSQ